MLKLTFESGGGRPLALLVIGAHADDIEIGCGGTLLRLAAEGRLGSVRWVVFSATGARATESRNGATAFLPGVSDLDVDVGAFRDGYFPSEFAGIKNRFEALKSTAAPDLVIVPRQDDRHQDHRLIAELAWQTFRDHVILEYEIPKWDADLAAPNVYVELSADTARRKAELLAETFPSQAGRHWFTTDTFVGLSRLRGIECRAGDGHAEAFFARKLVW